MNKIFLWLIMLPSALWRNMGADVEQLKAILTIKMKLDDRKPQMFGRRQQEKTYKYSSTINMISSCFVGIVYIFPMLAFKDLIFAMFAYYVFFLFILSFSLVTDFANVIIDTKDKYIILPRPVNDATLVLARLLHIFVYLVRIVLPMSLPGWIVLYLNWGGKAAAIFPVPLLLMTFMSLFLVNGIYLLVLRLSKPGTFKRILDSFQIALSIAIIACYYLLQIATKSTMIKNLDPSAHKWVVYTPPYWLASFWAWQGYPVIMPMVKWLPVAAIIVPLICLWATIRWLAPKFAGKLAEIDTLEVYDAPVKKGKKQASDLYMRLANMFNTSDAAKAGFMLTWLQTSRSRTFKLRVYPALAYVPIFFVFMIFMNDAPFDETWEQLPHTKGPMLILLYMSAFVMLQALNYINMSDQYKASWVYYVSPLQVPGHVLAGAFKALWIKYYLPFICLIGLFVINVWGIAAVWDVLLALVNVTVFTLCIMRLMHRTFPFSVMDQVKTGGVKGVVRVLSTMILMFVLGTVHYIASVFLWIKILILVLSCLFLWLVWDTNRNTSWAAINAAE